MPEPVFVVTDIEVDGPWPVAHTHEAIDDPRGYAHLLVSLLQQREQRPSHP